MLKYLALAIAATYVASFSPNQNANVPEVSVLKASRRDVLYGLSTVSFSLGLPSIATAASGTPTPEELDRIRTGYKQIDYLLKNFEQETTGT